ncbi:MAG: 16S rRNA (uracil(1498)-N(3))-methyltransferase [Gammaproteobacteria bacterium]|nr:16S rRNA (uracil(1498)-N(3))-methyltransferase [Gammaproteobacteria bacterium]
MRTIRIYVNDTLENGRTVALGDSAATHVTRVLRLRPGDAITLFNGQGGEFPSTIAEVSKRGVTVLIGAPIDHDTESPLAITLAQGISRGERMDFCLQKATELGVSRVVPLLTQRCNVQLNGDRLERRLQHWHGILVAACEQCGRNRIPELLPVMELDQWLQQAARPAALRLVLHHRGAQPLSSHRPAQSVELLIGPEGGLEEAEISAATSEGYIATRLGPRILRTETAAVTALAALQTLWGDFSH